jgi:double-stranded uracil-DNA glycosylase
VSGSRPRRQPRESIPVSPQTRRGSALPSVPGRPTRAHLEAARGRTVADVIAPGLRVLFCGINPGLYTAAVGHHFARPGNRFWPTLHRSGFTERVFAPAEERLLLARGYGITNLVERATATAGELSAHELSTGRDRLEEKSRRFGPAFVAVVGIGAYRTAFGRPRADLGEQPELLGEARVWVLPNTSGLNAHYQLDDLARLFGRLREAAEDAEPTNRSQRRRGA